MNRNKNWQFFIPSCLLLLSMTSCALAKGDYSSDKTQAEGISLSANQKTGSFIYKIKTNKANQNFSKLSISFNNSRITNPYGDKDIKIKISVSKTAEFLSEGTVSIEENIPVTTTASNWQFSFDSKGDELKALKANELYVKTEIILDEDEDVFDPSWIVLGNMRIFGGEQLDNGEDESSSYLEVDFQREGYEKSLDYYGVKLTDNHQLVPEAMGVAGYISYKVTPQESTNTFQSMKIQITDSILKSYSYTEKDEEGQDVEREIETGLNVYVSTTDGAYPTNPSAMFRSTKEGLSEAVIDITSAVERISVPDVYVRIEFVSDGEIPTDDTYLALGKMTFIGEESQKVDSYLTKDFKEGIEDAISTQNFVHYKEKAQQLRIVLKGNDECEYSLVEYDDDGTPVERKSTVCTWTEKGIAYNSNWVAGLTEAQLTRVLNAYGISLNNEKSYTGTKIFNKLPVKVNIQETFNGYYELIYDVTETFGEGEKDDGTLSRALKSEAYRFSSNVFQDFTMQGGGNVVYVNHDGQREVYVHEGKTLIRVTDNKIVRK